MRGYNGSRTRTLTGTFGKTEITVPRARLQGADGATTEWKSKALRAYQRRTKAADALIASAYLSGTNTRRGVRRALAALFGGAVGKDTVSRVWRKVQTDWDAWNARPLKDEQIVRLILDGTVVRVRLDRKATAISLLVVIGVRGNAGTAPEIVDRAERLLGASGDDGGSIGVGETFDHTDVEPYCEAILPVRWLQGAVPSGGIDADRSHIDTVVARITHDLRGCVEAHRLGIEKRRAEHVGMPALHPGGRIGDQREARRMALGEAVAAKTGSFSLRIIGG